MTENHSAVREGIVAGFLGATAIAIWFLIVDTIAGQAFYTPQILGRGLLNILGPGTLGDTPLVLVAVYTIFHYMAFVLIGIVTAAVVHQAERTPAILAGFLILFVAFELGFYGLTALLVESPLGGLAWYQIGLANLLSAGLMFWYMWKRHPALTAELRQALEGEDD